MEPVVADERCRSCGAPRGVAREYCLECGSRIVPPASKPIHWLWPGLATLVAAAAGGAIAAASSHGGSGSAQTLVATQRLVTVPVLTAKGKGSTKPRAGRKRTTGAARLVPWPGSGYTIVVAAIPASKGIGVAKRKALAALAAGLPQVGVLLSSSYPGLHPGYFMVFAGVYGTLDEAESALPIVRPDFPSAYARLVAR